MESKNYLICVGGTGTRILRAVIHNCAAGIIQEEEINVIVIDADQKNATWDYVKKDYDNYQNMYRLFKSENGEVKEQCFKTKINFLAGKNMISPVAYEQCKKLKESLYGDVNLERMMGWLYTEGEMNEDLEAGFFARPNVGCVFFSHFENEIFNNLLVDIVEHLNKNRKVNILLIGSIFGGTGASGLPTISKLIDKHIYENIIISGNNVEHLNVGAVFMMPYFTAKYVDKEEPLIKIDDFNETAKEALKYYKEEKYFDTNKNRTRSFQSLYLVQSQKLDLVNVYAKGGKEQDNKPHIAEEYAALAVSDFLKKSMVLDSVPNKEEKTAITLYKIGEKIGWDDLPPVLTGKDSLQKKMGDLTRFSVVYHNCMCAYMESRERDKENQRRKKDKDIPQWYVTFIPQQIDSEFKSMSSNVNEYCQSFLEWLSMLQEKLEITENDKTYPYNDKIQLFGEIITKIAGSESDVAHVVENVNIIKDNFDNLICAGSNLGYALKEIFLILSKLGTAGAMEMLLGNTLKGASGVRKIINNLYQLVNIVK